MSLIKRLLSPFNTIKSKEFKEPTEETANFLKAVGHAAQARRTKQLEGSGNPLRSRQTKSILKPPAQTRRDASKDYIPKNPPEMPEEVLKRIEWIAEELETFGFNSRKQTLTNCFAKNGWGPDPARMRKKTAQRAQALKAKAHQDTNPPPHAAPATKVKFKNTLEMQGEETQDCTAAPVKTHDGGKKRGEFRSKYKEI
jgi:hypothetical protein